MGASRSRIMVVCGLDHNNWWSGPRSGGVAVMDHGGLWSDHDLGASRSWTVIIGGLWSRP